MELKLKIPPTLLGLALACSAGLCSNSLADTTNILYTITFEAADPPENRTAYTYPYSYSAGYDITPDAPATCDANYSEPPDYTNTALHFTFENTAFTPIPSGGSYGFGFGGSFMNWTNTGANLTSSNREDYFIEFDAKVEGLAEGTTNANGEFQVRFDAPVDSTGLPNSTVLQVNIGFTPGTNWAHYKFNLSQGSLAENTTDANFSLYRSFVNEPRFGCNWHMPDGAFGFDYDNGIYLDNIQLSVVEKTYVPPPPIVLVSMADWNFDDKPLTSAFGGYNWSQNSFAPTFTYSTNADGYGVGGSNAWVLMMDNSTLEAPNTPQYAGGGMGGSGQVDFTRFVTGELSSYQVSFNTRVIGLADNIANTSCRLQLFFDAPEPDNTLVRLDFTVPASTNWQKVSYLLNKGVAGAGSTDNFKASFAKINALRAQFQIENANSTDWGFDTNNVLVIDDFKLDERAVACPALTGINSSSSQILTWDAPTSGTCKLQTATSVNGPWTDLPTATSPYTNTLTGSTRFFRTEWIAPSAP